MASGVFFFRFLRLAVVAAIVYGFLFVTVHGWLFDGLYKVLIRDLSSERMAFAWRALLYAVFGLLVLAVNLVFDYAKVRAVVEDRRSMLGALTAAARFVRTHPGTAISLYALDAAAFLVLMAVWAVIAPGVGGSGFGLWARLVLGQVYVAARLALKLQFLASETSLFQAALAHARYTSAPQPSWPPSPMVEAITNRADRV
jgi:hypothetical protein